MRVTVDRNDQLDIAKEVPIKIFKKNRNVTKGTFIKSEFIEINLKNIKETGNAKILDEGKKDGNTYTFLQYNGDQFIHIMHIGNSKTGIILENAASKESALDVFNHTKFEIKK